METKPEEQAPPPDPETPEGGEGLPPAVDIPSADEGPKHFLQSASRSLDEQTGSEAPPEEAPAPEPILPAGPLRLDELRRALKTPGHHDKDRLTEIRTRLSGLRERMANGQHGAGQ